MQEEVAPLQCPCGYPIVCEVQSLMGRLGAAIFLDEEPTSETYGETVKSCPGCGEQLTFLTLLLRNQCR